MNSTGLPFNSVQAVERAEDGLSNPMVNAGAIAATSLAPGDDCGGEVGLHPGGVFPLRGPPLALDEEVYASEVATNRRNLGIANLLEEQEGIWFDPEATTDLYTRQCALSVTTATWP